ncbi:amino acid adenylation domain-containing protein, partial [Xanthomonas campestris pv. campestris]
PLPALPIQYADYAVWQRQWLQGAELARQMSFWRAHLSGAPALLSLPTDRPRPAMQSYRGAMVPVRLDLSLTHALQRLAQGRGVTLFMVLAAAWSLLLSRLSGEADVVIGVPVANRQRPEVEGLIGFFVNTLALRLPVDAAWTTDALLAHTREVVLSGFGHQDMPFEQVVEAVQPTRTLSYSPVFQTMLVLQNTPPARAALEGLSLSALPLESRTAQFDLTLVLQEDQDGIGGLLNYASDLFDAATMQRWVGHLQVLLEAMVASPQTAVGALPLMRPAQRRDLLEAFNATEAAFPDQALVHELFQTQVARTPQALAVDTESVRWTYAELNARANRLAHALRAEGVAPDARVALCLERGPPMVMAMLAVLKAGGAYVPLDPSYPRERLAYMLEDSAPVLVVSDEASRGGLPDSAQTVDVDSDWSAWPAHDLPAAGTTADHLAYVIYTSGSTGRPKGVMVEHRNIVKLVVGSDYAPIGVDDCVAHCANPAFDASTWELWACLLNGARLWVVAQETLLDPVRFAASLDAGRVTALWLTSGLFNEHAVQLQPAFSRLKHLLTGGDVLNVPKVAAALASAQRPGCLLNAYGPTETTTFACTHAIVPNDVTLRSIPIGTPIANTRVYLLDEQGEPVPMGVVGELWIGGAGVARGYLNQEALTQARFVPDRFAGTGRMYRSGDLGRYRSDGAIEFLGRNDAQVKLRGFRIELGEIESNLCALEGVREAAVMLRGHESQRQLVAYVVADEGSGSPQSWRAQLLQRLPEHMVPSAYVELPALPLTPNGKLDRQALPAPDDEAVARRAYRAPEGTTEQAIADVWCDLLGLARVGRDDHFFELGGHSLLAMRCSAQIAARLQSAIPLAWLFEAPQLHLLALKIDENERLRRDRQDAREQAIRTDVEAMSIEQVRALLEQKRNRSGHGAKP